VRHFALSVVIFGAVNYDKFYVSGQIEIIFVESVILRRITNKNNK